MYSWDRELEELLEDKLNEQCVSQVGTKASRHKSK